jgi:hypothetical protein
MAGKQCSRHIDVFIFRARLGVTDRSRDRGKFVYPRLSVSVLQFARILE